MIYLYGLVRGAHPVPAVVGMEGASAKLTTIGDVGAVHSEHLRLHTEADAKGLWVHEAVVEAALTVGPVLPCRFGTTVADQSDLVGMLADREERILDGLDHVDGRVEVAVRARLRGPADQTGDGPGEDPAGNGRAYLESRLRAHRAEAERRNRARPIAEIMHDGLRSAAVDAEVELVSTPKPAVSAAYLVDSGSFDRFVRLVDALALRHRDLELTCTGPWPPYSFVPDLAPAGARLAGDRL